MNRGDAAAGGGSRAAGGGDPRSAEVPLALGLLALGFQERAFEERAQRDRLVGPDGATRSLAGTSVGAAAGGAAGAAAPGSAPAVPAVERCAAPLGRLAVDDGSARGWFEGFSAHTGIASLEPLVRAVGERSGCFRIVAVGPLRLAAREGRGVLATRLLEAQILAAPGEARTVPADLALDLGDLAARPDRAAGAAAAGAVLGGPPAWGAGPRAAGSIVRLATGHRTPAHAPPDGGVAPGPGDLAALQAALRPYAATTEGQAAAVAVVRAFNRAVLFARGDLAPDPLGSGVQQTGTAAFGPRPEAPPGGSGPEPAGGLPGRPIPLLPLPPRQPSVPTPGS